MKNLVATIKKEFCRNKMKHTPENEKKSEALYKHAVRLPVAMIMAIMVFSAFNISVIKLIILVATVLIISYAEKKFPRSKARDRQGVSLPIAVIMGIIISVDLNGLIKIILLVAIGIILSNEEKKASQVEPPEGDEYKKLYSITYLRVMAAILGCFFLGMTAVYIKYWWQLDSFQQLSLSLLWMYVLILIIQYIVFSTIPAMLEIRARKGKV